MIGLMTPKNEYFYIGKWRSNDDRDEVGFFRFKIASKSSTFKTDYNNMSGTEGLLTIETMSGIEFKIHDFIYWKKQRFNIVNIEENYKIENEQAFSKFDFNGGLIKILTLRKAGNE